MTQSVVQSNIVNSSGASPVTLAFSSSTTANNGLAYILHFDDTKTITGITDTLGNTIVQVGSTLTTGNGGGAMWVVKKGIGGANTVNITFSGSLGFYFLAIFEVTDSAGHPNGFDVDTSRLVGDVTGTVDPSITFPTTTHANTISVAAGGANAVLNGAPTSGNFTTIGHGGFYATWYGDVVLTATGVPAAAWSSTANWLLGGMALYTVTSGGSSVVFRRTLSALGTRTGSRQVHNRWKRSDRGGLLLRDPLIVEAA